MAFADDEFAEVAIEGDQDALFPLRDLQNVWVSQSGRVISRRGHDVMTETSELGGQAQICTLVNQELHTLVLWAPAGCSR